jgi:hypothetical protein
MFEWIIFRLGAFCLMLSTVLIGGGFVLCSWLEAVRNRWSTKVRSKIPTALYPFSILIAWDSIALIYLDSDVVTGLPERQVGAIWLSVLTASLAFLIATRLLVRRISLPKTDLVAIGSKVIVVTSAVSFVVMILGIPGLWGR